MSYPLAYDERITAAKIFSQSTEHRTPYTMTEGLKVNVKGAELRELCLKALSVYFQKDQGMLDKP